MSDKNKYKIVDSAYCYRDLLFIDFEPYFKKNKIYAVYLEHNNDVLMIQNEFGKHHVFRIEGNMNYFKKTSLKHLMTEKLI